MVALAVKRFKACGVCHIKRHQIVVADVDRFNNRSAGQSEFRDTVFIDVEGLETSATVETYS